jgi:hypothetical protein
MIKKYILPHLGKLKTPCRLNRKYLTVESTSEYQNPKSGPCDEQDYFSFQYSNGLDYEWLYHISKIT